MSQQVRYSDKDRGSGPDSNGRKPRALRERKSIFYGRVRKNGQRSRRQGGIPTRKTHSTAQGTTSFIIPISTTNPSSNIQRPNSQHVGINGSGFERAVIISRSTLHDGDVRFVIEIDAGGVRTQRTVTLEVLSQFVSNQQLHDFENEQFAREHEAKESTASRGRNPRIIRDVAAGKSRAGIMQNSEGIHYYRYPTPQWTPINRPRKVSSHIDNGQSLQNTATPPAHQSHRSHRSQRERSKEAPPTVKSPSIQLRNGSLGKLPIAQPDARARSEKQGELETQSNAQSTPENPDENDSLDATTPLRQFQESKVSGLDQRSQNLPQSRAHLPRVNDVHNKESSKSAETFSQKLEDSSKADNEQLNASAMQASQQARSIQISNSSDEDEDTDIDALLQKFQAGRAVEVHNQPRSLQQSKGETSGVKGPPTQGSSSPAAGHQAPQPKKRRSSQSSILSERNGYSMPSKKSKTGEVPLADSDFDLEHGEVLHPIQSSAQLVRSRADKDAQSSNSSRTKHKTLDDSDDSDFDAGSDDGVSDGSSDVRSDDESVKESSRRIERFLIIEESEFGSNDGSDDETASQILARFLPKSPSDPQFVSKCDEASIVERAVPDRSDSRSDSSCPQAASLRNHKPIEPPSSSETKTRSRITPPRNLKLVHPPSSSQTNSSSRRAPRGRSQKLIPLPSSSQGDTSFRRPAPLPSEQGNYPPSSSETDDKSFSWRTDRSSKENSNKKSGSSTLTFTRSQPQNLGPRNLGRPQSVSETVQASDQSDGEVVTRKKREPVTARRVEGVLDARILKIDNRTVRYYFIKWSGRPETANSWEAEDDLVDEEEALRKYHLDAIAHKQAERDRTRRAIVGVLADRKRAPIPKEWVEDVLDDRIIHVGKKPVRNYLIKWVGRSESENSWEPEDVLDKATVALKNYRMVAGVRLMTTGESSSHRHAVIVDLTGDE